MKFKLFDKGCKPHPALLFVCALLVALNPLAMDLYLPAFEEIRSVFSTSYKNVNLTLSIYLIFSSVGFFLGGAISDHTGRKPVICFGIVVFLLSALAIPYCETISQVIILRAIQAFGGAIAGVNASAIIRDVYPTELVGRKYALMIAIMLVTPMLAPLLGVVILKNFYWGAIFHFLFVCGCMVLFVFSLTIPETVAQKTKLRWRSVLHNFKSVILYKNNNIYQSILLLCISTFTFSLFLIIIVNSSYIYVEHFQLSLDRFTVQLAINGAALMVSYYLSNIVLRYIKPASILQLTSTVQMFSMFLVAYLAYTQTLEIIFYSILMAWIFLFTGLTTSAVVSIYVKPFKKVAGTASSLSSTFSLLLNGIIASVPFIWIALTFFNIVLIQLCCISLVWILVRWVPRITAPSTHP